MATSWFRTLTGSISSLIVWAVHFGVVYSLVSVGCDQGWHRVPLLRMNGLTVLLIAVTLPALGIIAWIGRGGWHSHRKAGRDDVSGKDSRRWRFLGLVTLAVAVLAFVSTVMTAVPMMMLPPCN